MKKIIIIGGGIAGLACAYRIQEEIENGADIQCEVLEASGHFGGKIHTERFDGFLVERGPDSFISQKPWAIQLCKKIGLADRLTGTNPDQTKTYVYTGKRMVTMPDGLSLMIPTKFMPFALSPLFSWAGKIRMGMDLFLPGKGDDKDESLASFIRRRLGEEALRKMAEPMLAGIYASDPETMSIKSTFPMFFQAEQKYRSLILGALARKRQASTQPAVPKGPSPFTLFMTLKNGLGEMTERLLEKCPNISFRPNTGVNGISKNGSGWKVELKGEDPLSADIVISAVPAGISAKLLRTAAPKTSGLLEKIKYVSTATVSIAYKKEGFAHPLNGFGFVVPRNEGRQLLACTWTSSKFPSRVPEGHVMLRCFVGGATREELAEQAPEEIEAMIKSELREVMGITQEPVFCKVFHNRKSNVQYRVGHADLIAEIESSLSETPGLYLTGSAYHGIGIPDCVHDGTLVAEKALQALAPPV